MRTDYAVKFALSSRSFREAAMDPLSDMLSLLRVRSYMSGGFDAGGDWSLHFDPHEGIKFYAVISGKCWLSVDGEPYPVRVRSGDCFLLPRGRAFRMASDMSLTPLDAVTFLSTASSGVSDMSLTPLDAVTFLSTAQNGRINLYNGGGHFLSVCGHFVLAGDHADVLLGVLPSIVHIHKESDKAMLRWCVDQMMDELREPRPGNSLVIEHLAHMMLVQALRLHMADGPKRGPGFLFALADKQASAAIKCMHDD